MFVMMLPNSHLTSDSRMSGSRSVVTPLWLSGSLIYFLYTSSVYFSPPLLNIFYLCYIHTFSVLYSAHLCMKYSLVISNFLEEISSLSHSIIFLLFLCGDDRGRRSYFSLLFFGTVHSDEECIYKNAYLNVYISTQSDDIYIKVPINLAYR